MTVKFISAKEAKLLANKTARKILEALTKKKSTSQLAKELDLPLTTIDYNISQLKQAGLIKSGYYKWSKRGNKMKLYEPAGEILVYAPEQKPGLLEAMNKLVIPGVLAVAGGFGYIVQKLFYRGNINTFLSEEAVTDSFIRGGTLTAEKSTEGVVTAAAPQAADMTNTIVENVTNTTVYITESTSVQAEPQLWFWFMLVAAIVLLILYIIKIKNKK
jgi:DNA-binding transcriptional ArsR family regulator